MAVLTNRDFVLPGNEGSIPGSDSSTSVQEQVFTARGLIDLSLNRLPNDLDLTDRPAEPFAAYDILLVSVAGSVPAGVTGVTTLGVGDYLLLADEANPTVASSWRGVVNRMIPPVSGNPFYGAVKWVKTVAAKLPFYPVILLTVFKIAATMATSNLI